MRPESRAGRESVGVRSFKLQDIDKHWWEISNVTQSYYDEINSLFGAHFLSRQVSKNNSLAGGEKFTIC
jgi:hypothetical protein